MFCLGVWVGVQAPRFLRSARVLWFMLVVWGPGFRWWISYVGFCMVWHLSGRQSCVCALPEAVAGTDRQ
jgi:hypothetical protein